MIERKGEWIETYTGRQFYPLDSRPEDFCMEDIAHALSNLCRYTGHTDKFYSVAEHSVWVSMMVPPQHAKWGLMHDATEAYIGDMSRPLKKMIPQFGEIERDIMRQIATKFKLDENMPYEVHDIDIRICHDERAFLMCPPENEWSLPGVAVGAPIIGLTPNKAEYMFIRRFEYLFFDHPRDSNKWFC